MSRFPLLPPSLQFRGSEKAAWKLGRELEVMKSCHRGLEVRMAECLGVSR